MMSENKKFPGDFYTQEITEAATDDCPNCMYKFKKAEKHLDECPNCHYIPKKSGPEEEK